MQDDRTIIVQRVHPYGKTIYRPVNDLAERLAHLLKQTVFSEADIQNLKNLNFEIKLGVKEETL